MGNDKSLLLTHDTRAGTPATKPYNDIKVPTAISSRQQRSPSAHLHVREFVTSGRTPIAALSHWPPTTPAVLRGSPCIPYPGTNAAGAYPRKDPGIWLALTAALVWAQWSSRSIACAYWMFRALRVSGLLEKERETRLSVLCAYALGSFASVPVALKFDR